MRYARPWVTANYALIEEVRFNTIQYKNKLKQKHRPACIYNQNLGVIFIYDYTMCNNLQSVSIICTMSYSYMCIATGIIILWVRGHIILVAMYTKKKHHDLHHNRAAAGR